MTKQIMARVYRISHYIIKNKSTVRATAKVFNISKSTVHNDIHKRLPKLNKDWYEKISKIMSFNFEEKHLRGGLATKEKYKSLAQLQ